MKAVINGVQVTGTPAEIKELMELVNIKLPPAIYRTGSTKTIGRGDGVMTGI